MITGAAVLVVDGTYPAADGQGQAPPGRLVIIAVMEEATGADAIKAPFTVFFLVPDNLRLEGFLRELNEGDSENLSLS
jgi:hypothetical protein